MFCRAVYIAVVCEVSVEIYVVEGGRKKLKILGERGKTAVLGGCIPYLVLRWLWIIYLFAQPVKADFRVAFSLRCAIDYSCSNLFCLSEGK